MPWQDFTWFDMRDPYSKPFDRFIFILGCMYWNEVFYFFLILIYTYTSGVFAEQDNESVLLKKQKLILISV